MMVFGYQTLALLCTLILAAIPSAVAIGVAADYLEGDVLELPQGGWTTYGIRLQNPTSGTYEVELDYDDSLGTVIGGQKRFILEPQTYRNAVTFNITGPPGARPGDEFTFFYSMVPIVQPDSGAISIKTRVGNRFTLRIVGNPDLIPPDGEQASSGAATANPWLLVGILVLASGIAYVLAGRTVSDGGPLPRQKRRIK
ncbi:hypothetical protein JXB02_02775 [Candidatus Woesearchaeota archaeon]|nr:hypothetical protein [Candidatus Woesearchaeota archaeon]